MSTASLDSLLIKYQEGFHPVLDFDPASDRLMPLNLSVEGGELPYEESLDTDRFVAYMDKLRVQKQARYLIGGYGELRGMYGRSELFDGEGEARRLHLGTDIWGEPGTPVYAFLGGMVHSFAFNDRLGDYGATLILLHQLEGKAFYSLYGHIALKDIQHLNTGQYVNRGQEVAHFGEPVENGYWPPHLHFQLIEDIGLHDGDYPGVCRNSEKGYWLANSPDPDLVLNLNRYLNSVVQSR